LLDQIGNAFVVCLFNVSAVIAFQTISHCFLGLRTMDRQIPKLASSALEFDSIVSVRSI
jgi:hypothetical protein